MKKAVYVTGIAMSMLVLASVLCIAFYSALSALGATYQGVSITEWTVGYIQQHPVAYGLEFVIGAVMAFTGAESLYRDWVENR